jgi:phosphoribosylanthranilate isomerase
MIDAHPGAAAILLDSWRADKPGGTGDSFNWRQVPANSTRPLVLAGGLNAGNVGRAISMTHPFAVDVSGGVEESPGIKSREKIEEFVAAVHAEKTESGKSG